MIIAQRRKFRRFMLEPLSERNVGPRNGADVDVGLCILTLALCSKRMRECKRGIRSFT